jgi:hypothetical protein
MGTTYVRNIRFDSMHFPVPVSTLNAETVRVKVEAAR